MMVRYQIEPWKRVLKYLLTAGLGIPYRELSIKGAFPLTLSSPPPLEDFYDSFFVSD